MKHNLKDMTTGKPEKLILGFALPLFIGNVFQQLYNIADTMIVGHSLGEWALASIGATMPIYFLIITFLTGSNAGFSIIVARYFGAKDTEGVKKATGCAIILCFILTSTLTVIGLLMAYPILYLLGTPIEIIPNAHSYIRILYGFMALTMTFNLSSVLLQGLGNTRIPLFLQASAFVLNIILSFWFVSPNGLNLGVAGAATASIIAHSFASILGITYIIKKVPALHIRREHLKPDPALLKEMFLIGTSIGIGNSIISIGSIILQTAINNFGIYTITAFTTARKVFSVAFMPLMSTANAVANFTSQNLGAGKMERIKLGLLAGMKIAFVWSTLMVIMAFTIGEYIVQVMSGSQNLQVIFEASQYLRISLPFLYALSILMLYKSVLQGLGNKMIPVMSSIIELLGKIIATLWVVPQLQFVGVALAEPMIWVTCSIFFLFIFHHKKSSILPTPKPQKIKYS